MDPVRETSRGRYVFAPDGSPHYRGLHYLGSRNWTSDEREDAFLGETDGKQIYCNGAGPMPFPAAVVAGEEDCISNPRCESRPITHEFLGSPGVGFPPNIGKHGYRISAATAGGYQCQGHGAPGYHDEQILGVWTLDFPVDTRISWVMSAKTANSWCNDSPFFEAYASLEIDGEPVNTIGPTLDVTDCCYSDWQREEGVWDVKRGRRVIRMRMHVHAEFYEAGGCEWKFSFAPNNRQQYFRDGFPVECYLPDKCRPDFSPNDPDEWLRFARILEASYVSMGTVESMLLEAYGNANFASVANSSSVVPGSCIAWNDCMTTVVLPGTTNYQQLCLQVLDPGVGFQNFGAYSTAVVWQNAYLAIADRLAATTADPAQPILCVGHSYGGVVAALLAANLKAFQLDRDVRLLTFGMPRPGDIRLRNLLKPITRSHLANTGDFVTGIPPTGPELLGTSAILPTSLFLQWAQARIAGKQVVLTNDGQVFDDDESQLDFATLAVLIFDIVNSIAIPPNVPHFISEYKRRLLMI